MGAFAEGALINQLTSTVSSGGNLTLTVTSTSWQRITGTSTHTITLPDTTTMLVGREFVISNESTGDVTVNHNGGGLAAVIGSGRQRVYRLFSNGTADGNWTITDQVDVFGPLTIHETTGGADNNLNIQPNRVTASDNSNLSTPPIDDIINSFPISSIDFQTPGFNTGGTTGGDFETDGGAFTRPAIASGLFTRMVMVYKSADNVINTSFSTAAASQGALTNAGTLFSLLKGIPIGYIDLESTGASDFTFKTAGSTSNIIENSGITRFGSGGGGGGANTFDDIPLVPSFSGQDVAVGPSTNEGIDLVINNTKVAKTSSTTVNIKQNGAITKYSNNEFYSGIVSYNPSTDAFDVQYSADSHVDSATALTNLPLPVTALNYEVCRFSSEIIAVTPGNEPRTLYYRYDLNRIYNADIAGNIIEQASFTTESTTRDMAVSFSNNNFAIAYYDFGTGTNRIRLYNLTTFAFISEVASTTSGSGNGLSISVTYDSSVSRYVIFTLTDNSYPSDYLITEHNPSTGAEVTGATGVASVFAPWNGPRHIVYVSSINAFLGVYDNYGYYEIQDVSKADHTTTNLVTGLSEDSFLGYDSTTDELWHYKTDNTAKVYDVTAGPTLTFNRNETTSFLNLNSFQVGGTSFQFSGNVLDTVSPTSLDDTRQSINNVLAGSTPFLAGSDTTLTDIATYFGIFVEGDLTVDGNITVNGDVVVNGNLTINGNLNVIGDVYAYEIDVQTANHFDFEVKGSIQFGNPLLANSFLTASKFFNVGGDITRQLAEKNSILDMDVTIESSPTNMYVGGSIILNQLRLTILDDGATSAHNMGLNVQGNIITDGMVFTSENVASDRKIAPTAKLFVKGDIISGSFTLSAGDNSFASTNAFGGDVATIEIDGDVIVNNNIFFTTGDGTGAGGRCGIFSSILIRGDLLCSSTFTFAYGSSNSASQPSTSGFLNIYGNLTTNRLSVNPQTKNTGGGALPKLPTIICYGVMTCRQDILIGISASYTPVIGNTTWTASEFIFAEFIRPSNSNYPPGCLKYRGWRGFCRINVGRYQLYSVQVLPGFVAGSVGTADSVPDSIFAGTGMAVRRDITGSGTTYIWIEV